MRGNWQSERLRKAKGKGRERRCGAGESYAEQTSPAPESVSPRSLSSLDFHLPYVPCAVVHKYLCSDTHAEEDCIYLFSSNRVMGRVARQTFTLWRYHHLPDCT